MDSIVGAVAGLVEPGFPQVCTAPVAAEEAFGMEVPLAVDRSLVSVGDLATADLASIPSDSLTSFPVTWVEILAGSLVPASNASKDSSPAVGAAEFQEAPLTPALVGEPMASELAGAVAVEALPAEREVGTAAAVGSLRPPLASVTKSSPEDLAVKLIALAVEDAVDAMRELGPRLELRVTGMSRE